MIVVIIGRGPGARAVGFGRPLDSPPRAGGTDGPPYYALTNEVLARVMPRARTLVVPRAGHDALNRAPQHLVDALADFFAAPVTSEPAGS